MTMRGITTLAALALTLSAASAAEAAEPASTMYDGTITVVNEHATPMVVYAEDAKGELHEVAKLKAGEVKHIDTRKEGFDGTALKLHARPTNSASRWSTWGDTEVVSDEVAIAENEIAVFLIAPDLARSQVQIRPR
jgi:hypothetical protein